MAFIYRRTIHFSDTDAAGVVFFPRYLAICHEAYEEALAAAGVDLKSFFSEHAVMVPISRSEADYLRPLACGDRVRVTLTVAPLDAERFALNCELHRLGPPDKLAARVHTEHVCIAARTRQRHALPAPLAAWVRQHSA
jgi:1,4-dihydroxy-2-naphthoyl-CoA hydrolase